jgi:hypothetical protein
VLKGIGLRIDGELMMLRGRFVCRPYHWNRERIAEPVGTMDYQSHRARAERAQWFDQHQMDTWWFQ